MMLGLFAATADAVSNNREKEIRFICDRRLPELPVCWF
jgi:hypothetical protein